MRTALKARWGTTMLILAIVPRCLGQVAEPDETAWRAPLSSPGLAPLQAQIKASSESQTSGEIFREIDDPKDGARWLLSRDVNHPGGPGVLVLAGRTPGLARRPETGARPAGAVFVPVIRVGDRLILEEHSALVDARLEAIALAPGAVGSALRVRLIIGGQVVRARVLAPGRAVLEPETGGRP